MTEPYFDDGQVRLFLGDCREVTDWLTADVLVTDPPYGRGWRKDRFRTDEPGVGDLHRGIAGDKDTATRDAALNMWGDRPAVVFGDLMLAPPAGSKLTAVYRKPPDAGWHGTIGGFRRDLEAIYLLGAWSSGVGGQSSLLTTGARVQGNPVGTSGRYRHPHAKPVDVLEQLLAACPPGVVADPFAGSGSTLIAARNQGRKAIGVEIDEKYAEAAARRLSQTALDLGAAP